MKVGIFALFLILEEKLQSFIIECDFATNFSYMTFICWSSFCLLLEFVEFLNKRMLNFVKCFFSAPVEIILYFFLRMFFSFSLLKCHTKASWAWICFISWQYNKTMARIYIVWCEQWCIYYLFKSIIITIINFV